MLFGIPTLLGTVGVGIFFKPLRARHIRFSFPVLGLVFGLATGFFNAWDDHHYYSTGCQNHWYDVVAIFGTPGDGMANSYGGDWQEDEAWEYRADIATLNALFWTSVATAAMLLMRFMARQLDPADSALPNKRTPGNGAVAVLFHAERLRRAVPEPPRSAATQP
jgi:hypothetical protein